MRARSVSTGLSSVILLHVGCGPGPDTRDVGTDAPTYAFSMDPDQVEFGTACVGEGAAARVIRIANESSVPLVGLWPTMRGDPRTFAVDDFTCSRVEVGGSCTVTVSVSPDAEEGAARATLAVSLGGETREVILGVDLVWCDEGPDVLPTPHRFGDVVVGERSPPQRFTVRWIPLSRSRLSTTLSGLDAASFLIVADECDGLTSPRTGPCTVDVVFAPTHDGPCSAALVVQASPGHPSTTPLDGTGLARVSDVEIAPHDANLGVVGVGCEGPFGTLTLTSNGTIATGPLDISLGGDDASSFAIVRDGCGAGLAVGDHCDVDVRFVPLRPGSALATLDVGVTAGTRHAALTGLATTDTCAP